MEQPGRRSRVCQDQGRPAGQRAAGLDEIPRETWARKRNWRLVSTKTATATRRIRNQNQLIKKRPRKRAIKMPHLLRLLTVIIVSCSLCSSDHCRGPGKEHRAAKKPAKKNSTDQALDKTRAQKKCSTRKWEMTSLHLWFFYPKGHQVSDKRPAIVFFFGGGWNGGTPTQFSDQSQYLQFARHD